LLEGPTLPEWCGVGDPDHGYYAGEAGIAYAKILEEVWTEVSPTGAYWNPTRVQSDNRLPAFESHSSQYEFDAPDKASVNVEVRLLFRRAFIGLMDQKGWDDADILMEAASLRLTP
jgi:hypothetical protein